MVGIHAAHQNLGQLPATEPGAMAFQREIGPASPDLPDQAAGLGMAVPYDVAAVHDFAQTDDVIHMHQRFYIIIINDATGRFQFFICRWDRTGNGDINVTWPLLHCFSHGLYACKAEYVGNFMRFGNECRYTIADSSFHEGTRCCHCTFNMHVAIDEAGDYVLAIKIPHMFRLDGQRVISHITKSFPTDSQITGNKFFQIDIIDIPIF